MKGTPSKASVSFKSRSLGGYHSPLRAVTRYQSQLIQCTLRNTKNNSCAIFILNFSFWFALRKLIMRPSLSKRISLSIPINLRLCPAPIGRSPMTSKGSEASKSIKNLPFRIYFNAILFATPYEFSCHRVRIRSSEVD